MIALEDLDDRVLYALRYSYAQMAHAWDGPYKEISHDVQKYGWERYHAIDKILCDRWGLSRPADP